MNTDRLVSQETKNRMRKEEFAKQERALEISRMNHNFTQINNRAWASLRELIQDNPQAAGLLTILAEKMGRQNALVCSYDTLTHITGRSRTSLHRSIKYLKERRWIQVVKIGTANAYVVNAAVFWKSHGDKKLAAFSAAIIASSSEQDSTENWEDTSLQSLPLLGYDESTEAPMN